MQAHQPEMMYSRGRANARSRRSFGFSSAEVLLSLLVGSVLALSVSTRYGYESASITESKVERDLGDIVAALNHYRQDNEVFPSNAQGLDALVQRPRNLPPAPNWREDGYLRQLPLDPWGNRYQYIYPGLHGEFDVYSLGADGVPGGDGEDADIGNWAG